LSISSSTTFPPKYYEPTIKSKSEILFYEKEKGSGESVGGNSAPLNVISNSFFFFVNVFLFMKKKKVQGKALAEIVLL